MESLPFLSPSSLQTLFSILFFSFTIIFSIFSILLYTSRFSKNCLCCSCDICKAYVTSSWSPEFNNLCDWITHLLQNSPTRTIHIHVLGNTITANPDNVEHMLKTRFENYPKGKTFSMILGDLLGRGIFNVDGEGWKFQRKMASLELGSISIRAYAFDIVVKEIGSRLIPLLSSFSKKDDEHEDQAQVFDLQDVFRRFSFDSICKFSFGLDPGCLELSLPMSKFAVAFDLASKLSAERSYAVSPMVWKVKRFLNFGSEKELKQAIKMVNILADEVIRKKRKMGFETQQDLLSRFMGTITDDSYLRDIVISFLLAGRDTVASALTGFFLLLSNHPDVESAILEESNRVMGRSIEELATYEQMKEMPYLQAAMYESLRLYPPVQFDSKYALRDDELPDRTSVKKGTRVTYHPYAMARMEQVWGPDCREYKPSRWINQDGRFAPESPFKFSVFHAGFRVCLGKEMALVEMKIVALSLIRRFRIELSGSGKAPKFVPGLTATFRDGLSVRVRERRV